jgi:hypothetical protein
MATIPTAQDMTASLNRIYAAVDHLANLEGQDTMLTLDMSQAMINDLINDGQLADMATYIRRYCDVLDSPAEADEIAADI